MSCELSSKLCDTCPMRGEPVWKREDAKKIVSAVENWYSAEQISNFDKRDNPKLDQVIEDEMSIDTSLMGLSAEVVQLATVTLRNTVNCDNRSIDDTEIEKVTVLR